MWHRYRRRTWRQLGRGSPVGLEELDGVAGRVVGHDLATALADCLSALIDGAERDGTLRRLHHRYSNRRRAATALAGAVMYRRLMTARPLRGDEVGPLIATVLGGGPGLAP